MKVFNILSKILGIGILGVFAACASVNEPINSPESVASGFYRAIADGEIRKAVEYFDSSNLDEHEKNLISGKLQSVLGSMLDDIKEASKDIEIVAKEISNDGKNAKVEMLISGNGRQKTTTIDLIKVNGEWKIQVD